MASVRVTVGKTHVLHGDVSVETQWGLIVVSLWTQLSERGPRPRWMQLGGRHVLLADDRLPPEAWF